MQRRRLRGKYDLGQPSDNELQLMKDGAVKSRRRVEGKMQAFIILEWETVWIGTNASCLEPPPWQETMHVVDVMDALAIAPESDSLVDDVTPAPAARRSRAAPSRPGTSAGVPAGAGADDNEGGPAGAGGPTPAQAPVQSAFPFSEIVAAPNTAPYKRVVHWTGPSRESGMSLPQFRYVHSDILPPNSTHEFRVRTRNSVGWGEWSEPSDAVKTLPTKPFPPGA